MVDGDRSPVRMAGGPGFLTIGISGACSIGYRPEHDLKSGLAPVWPEFAEATQ
jgi:hypothetical protein